MNSRTLPVAILLAISAVPLCCQPGQVGGPVIGFLFDPSVRALRPILGIPGASTLGGPLDAGYELRWATVAPRQDSAIAAASDGSVHLLRLGSGAAETRCGACPSTADAAIFSPSGAAVALYAAGRVQILTGLPDAPAAGASFEVGSQPRPARGRALAPPIDDGAWLLASARDSVTLFGANGGPRRLLATGPYALVAFVAGSHDAAIADVRGAALALFRDVAGASVQQPVATPGDLRYARALAFSADGGRLLVASAAEQSVAVIDLASGTRTVAACDCAPSGLTAMGKVVRLNEPGNGPLWLLDTEGAAGPRVVFVPAARQE
jgi:hypothetical protein